MDDRSRDIEIIQQIDSYLKGKLSSDEAETLWLELLKSSRYMDYLETEILLKAISQERGSYEESSLQKSWRWIAAAAFCALFVVGLFFFADTQETLQQKTLDKISLADNLAAPMVLRSPDSRLDATDSLLLSGFESALSGDMLSAVNIYESIIHEFDSSPVAAQAYMNIGIIRYNSGDFALAAEAFENALQRTQDAFLQEKLYWYTGNTWIHLNELNKARDSIYRVYIMKGVYQHQAYDLLTEMDFEFGTEASGK